MGRGIDIVQAGQPIRFQFFLQDGNGDKVTTGTTTLRLAEIQDDGTYLSYDWNDNTFKAGALTTPTLGLTHRTFNNGTVNAGLWTGALSTLSGFTAGRVYVAQAENVGASPKAQTRMFQYGDVEGAQASSTDVSSILSAVAAVLSDTDNIQTRLPAALVGGRMAANAEVVGDKTGYALVATGLDLVLIDTKTLPAALRAIAAVVAGKVSGAGTGTETFVGLDGATTRAVVTVDSNGNRSNVTYP